MQRPLQVTIAAIITLAWAAESLVLGSLYTAGVLDLPPLDPTPYDFDPATLRVLTGAMTMFAAAWWAPIGIGLLRQRNWARILALVLYGIGVPASVFLVVNYWTSLALWEIVIQVAYGLTAGLIFWLLLQPTVREAFGVTTQSHGLLPDTRARPAGVNFLVLLCGIGAVGSLAFGIGYGFALPSLDPSIAQSPETVRMMRFGMIFGSLPWAAASSLCAIGLWRLRKWARILAIVLAALWVVPSLTFLVLGSFTIVAAPSLIAAAIFLVIALLLGAIPAWSLWYLFRPRTRKLFIPSAASPLPPSSPAA